MDGIEMTGLGPDAEGPQIPDDTGETDFGGGDETEPLLGEATGGVEPSWAVDPPDLGEDEMASSTETDKLVQRWKDEMAEYEMQPELEFRAARDGRLWLRWGRRWLLLTNERDRGRFLSVSTLRRRYGVDVLRALGVEGEKAPRLTDKQRQEAAKALQTTDRVAVSEDIEMDTYIGELLTDMPPLIGDVSDTSGDGDLLPLRELKGLDRSLRALRGSRAVQESKRVAIQQTIEELRKDLERAGDDQERRAFVEKEIAKASNDLEPVEESIRVLNGRLRSQVVAIRESLTQLLDGDRTLGDRIRTLFREQGVTIASILTAIGLAISTLVAALTGRERGATPPPPQPPSGGGAADWAKKQLKALGQALARLAGKAASALPGIIGSVVSWLLNLFSKTATWLAGNLWALAVALGGLLFVAAREAMTSQSRSNKPKGH